MQDLVEFMDNEGTRIKKLAREKTTYGMIFGICTGLAFAAAVWGIDGYSLSRVHALFPWLKFGLGTVICTVLGGLAGRIAAWLDKVYAAVLIWLVTSAIFAWLSLEIPFQMAPTLTLWLKPELKGLLQFPYYPDFQSRLDVVLVWTLILSFIVSLLQLPMSESAVFSVSVFGKLMPLIVSAILMIIAGRVVDSFNNDPFRNAITSMDSAIQFKLEHQGKQTDPQIVSELQRSPLNGVDNLVSRSYRLVVSNYDASLGEVYVLVEFGNTPVNCLTVYGQPAFCDKVSAAAP